MPRILNLFTAMDQVHLNETERKRKKRPEESGPRVKTLLEAPGSHRPGSCLLSLHLKLTLPGVQDQRFES